MRIPFATLFWKTQATGIRWLAFLCLVLVEADANSTVVRCAAVLAAVVAVLDIVQTTRAVRILKRISSGDRFVAFSRTWLTSATCDEIAEAGERMRLDLIEADAAIADQRRMLAESRIRRDGATFFTTRFHESVADAVAHFNRRGELICTTVEDLNSINAGLLRDARSVSDAVSGTESEVVAVTQAAGQIADVVATTSAQIADAEHATRATLTGLRQARETIERLKRAGAEIASILDIIRSVASQTSLLALNATIEAARAGEAGRGFAVVASEVKVLAARSSAATGTIRQQIADIQSAVEETAEAIDAIMGRVTTLTDTHHVFTRSLSLSTAAIERVGSNAGTVAARVSQAMPDLASGVREIETAGRSVLTNAQTLMAGSRTLVANFRTYFEDLTSGSIKIGILHSLSGTMTATERPLHDMLIGLIDETNAAGGLLGRPLEALIVNPRAVPEAYAEGARSLLSAGATVIFGGWTSQSRLAMIPVLERAQALLVYPSQYEGGESSPHILYAGGTPQQQAFPAIDFLIGLGFTRLVLVGCPSIYSSGTHAHIKRHAPSVGATIVADLQIDADGVARAVAAVSRAERRGKVAVVATLPGDLNVPFCHEMARQGFKASETPVLSLSVAEAELSEIHARTMVGHYLAWNYLSGIKGDANRRFVDKWRRICGDPTAVTNDALEATYIGFSLWKAAVESAGTTQTAAVRGALAGSSFRAPSGFDIVVTPDQHTTLPAFIGQIRADGRIVPVWSSRTMLTSGGEPVAQRPAAA